MSVRRTQQPRFPPRPPVCEAQLPPLQRLSADVGMMASVSSPNDITLFVKFAKQADFGFQREIAMMTRIPNNGAENTYVLAMIARNSGSMERSNALTALFEHVKERLDKPDLKFGTKDIQCSEFTMLYAYPEKGVGFKKDAPEYRELFNLSTLQRKLFPKGPDSKFTATRIVHDYDGEGLNVKKK